MSPELTKKERIALKRQALVEELYKTFIHSYEMDRAWNMPQRKAFDKAFKAVNILVEVKNKQRPQETSFVIGCRSEAKELIIKRVTELENQVTKNVGKKSTS